MTTANGSYDCPATRELLDSYIAGELSVESHALVTAHVGQCDACAAELDRRHDLRGALRAALGGPVDDDVRLLTARITTAIAREDARPPTANADEAGPSLTRRAWMSAAAGVLLSLGGWRWLSQPGDAPASGRGPAISPATVDPAMYAATAQSHRMCALMRPQPATPPSRDEIQNRLLRYAGLADVVSQAPQGFDVRDVHVCPNGDRTYAHVVLTRDDETVSVFVSEAHWGDLPPGTDTFALETERDAQLVHEDAFTIGAIQRGPRVGFVVSSREAAAHAALARPWLAGVDRLLATMDR